jgi:serine/threonine-protein kinase RsbW
MSSGSSPQEVVSARLVLRNRRDEIDAAQRRLVAEVEGRHYDRASCFAIRLAVEEALSNALRHGNRNEPDRTIRLEYRVDQQSVIVDIQDEGAGFDPATVPDPTRDENLEMPSGRGLVLMRAYMTRVTFIPPGNRVRLEYERPRTPAARPD